MQGSARLAKFRGDYAVANAAARNHEHSRRRFRRRWRTRRCRPHRELKPLRTLPGIDRVGVLRFPGTGRQIGPGQLPGHGKMVQPLPNPRQRYLQLGLCLQEFGELFRVRPRRFLSGALATNFSFDSFLCRRAISSVTLAISFCRRAASAERSIRLPSGRQKVASPTTICAEPFGTARLFGDVADPRQPPDRRLMARKARLRDRRRRRARQAARSPPAARSFRSAPSGCRRPGRPAS